MEREFARLLCSYHNMLIALDLNILDLIKIAKDGGGGSSSGLSPCSGTPESLDKELTIPADATFPNTLDDLLKNELKKMVLTGGLYHQMYKQKFLEEKKG